MITHKIDVCRHHFSSPLTATIGSFDGVHVAHRKIINQLLKSAENSGTESALITFDPHPRIFIEGDKTSLKLLTTLKEKQQILEQLGVDHLIVLGFNDFLRTLSAREFCDKLLVEKLGVKNLLVGYDNHIGSDRKNTAEFLATYSDIECVMIDKISTSEKKISSTMVRNLLLEGEISRANQLLASPYCIIGRVGEKSSLILENPYKLLPPKGRYQCKIGGNRAIIAVEGDGFVSIEGVDLVLGEEVVIFVVVG